MTPFYVDKPAWLVVIPDSMHFLFGLAKGAQFKFKAILAVFVDSETGSFLEAVTLEP